jgi:chromosome segregation ATPase
MDLFEFLLSGPALLGLVGLLSLAIVGHALAGFLGQTPDLRLRLQSLQRELDRLREGLPEKKIRVEAARQLLEPLKKELQTMQTYHRKLREIERQADQQQKEEKASDEIQIHRPGIPGL